MRVFSCIAILLAFLAVAACGDDDDDDATATATEEATEAEIEGADAGDNPVAVEATEFQFTLDTDFFVDTTGFTLTNSGEQPHEAFIVRISEDAVVDELLASEEEQPEGLEAEVGGTFAEPGNEAGFGFEEPLEPGRYLMLCFVEDEETGQPHALLGMVAEFTVE